MEGMGTGARAPYFTVGDGYAAYRGPVDDLRVHAHAAFQVAIAVHGEVRIEDASGRCHQGAALLVPPGLPHRMLPSAEAWAFYVEPVSALADELRERAGSAISVVDDLRGLGETELVAARSSRRLDPRLVRAMTALDEPGRSMTDVAAEVGLSPQRLRSLAREQLGMPLARWRVWLRLRRTAEELAAGRPLAEAALAGGFADQAHLTRWMREMIGLTPGAALPALRGQGPLRAGGPRRPRSSR
jgi:AraC-like DNA-binding protein